MSNIINYTPASGNTNAVVKITAKDQNTTYEAKKTTLTVTGESGLTAVVEVIQHYKPVVVQFGGTTVPASGGTVLGTVHSAYYDVVFRSVPDYVTIKDTQTGTVYTQGQTIKGDNIDGHTFEFIVDANTSTSQRSPGNTFNMGHYINGSLAQQVSYITFTQEAAEQTTLETTPASGSTTILDYAYSYPGFYDSAMVTINYNKAWRALLDNTNFTVSKARGAVATNIFVNTQENTSGEVYSGTLTVVDQQDTTKKSVLNFRQLYKPVVNQFGSTTIPASGGSVYVEVKSLYDYAFRFFPDWIKVYVDSTGTEIAEGRKITGTGVATTYRITAEANTGETRSGGNSLNIAHYSRDGQNMHPAYNYITFTQEGVAPTKNINISPIYVNVGSGDTSTEVNIITENCTLDHFTTSSYGSFTVTATRSGNKFILSFPATDATTSTTGHISFYLYDEDGNAYTSTIDVVRAAGPGRITISPAEVYVDYDDIYPAFSRVGTTNVNSNTNWTVALNTNLTFDPVVGSGDDDLDITAITQNTTTENYTYPFTITTGDGVSASGNVIQRHKPVLNQFGSTTIPASGGSIYFEVKSGYDYVFRSLPSWITLWKDTANVQVSEGQRITGDDVGITYRITAGANTGSERSVGTTFNMAHYSKSSSTTLAPYYNYLSFKQEASSQPQPSYVLDYDVLNNEGSRVRATIDLQIDHGDGDIEVVDTEIISVRAGETVSGSFGYEFESEGDEFILSLKIMSPVKSTNARIEYLTTGDMVEGEACDTNLVLESYYYGDSVVFIIG